MKSGHTPSGLGYQPLKIVVAAAGRLELLSRADQRQRMVAVDDGFILGNSPAFPSAQAKDPFPTPAYQFWCASPGRQAIKNVPSLLFIGRAPYHVTYGLLHRVP